MADHAHETVRRLFDQVLDVPADERASILNRECGDDESLKQRILAMIAAAEESDFLGNATTDVGPGEPSQIASAERHAAQREDIGEQILRYKLLQPIGEGGFGTVWMAEQSEPVQRRVAIKIIKLGMDTERVIARFEAERQALAMMDHSNIAKVFDAGSTESGRPYFVMEYIRGVPILEYCDTQKVDTAGRLGLFTQVCHAIQHAHQKGIIHRDIKPSNVLVTMHDGVPVPKVIDFGIAKATHTKLTQKTVFTEHKQLIGTPAYMSPEQAEMSGIDIDTRTDIYALGVLLYEMLTGTTPFTNKELANAGFEGMMRLIREVVPHKPSTRLSSLGETAANTAQQRRADVHKLGLILRGDLDWIVMKCLEKDRTRRYDTASGLATDIRRHLEDEPVLAGPPSTAYRLRKFVKRNRVQVVASVVVVAALVLGVFGTSVGLTWALREKDRADEQAAIATNAAESADRARVAAQENERLAVEEAARAEAAEAETRARSAELEEVVEFQSEQLSAIEPEVMGIKLRRALLNSVPEEERDTLSDALSPVNFTTIALESLEENIFVRTIDAIETQFAEQPLVQARLLLTVSETLRNLGLLQLAADPLQRALRIHRELLGDEHLDTLTSIHTMGALLRRQGRLVEAEAYLREAVEGLRRVLGDEHPRTLSSVSSLGVLLVHRGMVAEAERYLRQVMESRRRVLGDDDPDTLLAIHNMGTLLSSQGRLVEAERYYLEALEGYRSVLGDDHSRTLSGINNMAMLFRSQGRLAEAERYLRDALESSRRVLGDDHPDTLLSIHNMGALLWSQRRLVEAERYYLEAVEGNRSVLGDDHSRTLSSINNLAVLYRSQGRIAEAERYLQDALETSQRVFGAADRRTLTMMSNYALVLAEMGRGEEALALADEAVDTARRVVGDESSLVGNILGKQGQSLQALGKYDEAAVAMREAHATLSAALGDEHRQTQLVVGYLASLFAEWHVAEPDAGYAASAAEWRAKLIRPADSDE